MSNRCIDCNERPRLGDLGSCYAESFTLRARDGLAVSVTLRLCVRCGARFVDRLQLRDYLRSKLQAQEPAGTGAAAHP